MSAPPTAPHHRPINYTAFIARVERDTGVSRADAERAVKATLKTLGERLSSGQSRDLAAQLPPELAEVVASNTKARRYDVDEFVRRVAEREQADIPAAREHVRAVFAALGRAIGAEELKDMASELPRGFAPLISDAQPPPSEQPERPPTVSAEEFAQRVARRGGLDRAAATRATEAVLEVLAERISGGQCDDLAEQLPPELKPPLRRGKIRSNAAARPLSLSDFINAIAEREGVPPNEAREHARAVLATLRETVSKKEFADTVAQLPDEYRALLAPAD